MVEIECYLDECNATRNRNPNKIKEHNFCSRPHYLIWVNSPEGKAIQTKNGILGGNTPVLPKVVQTTLLSW